MVMYMKRTNRINKKTDIVNKIDEEIDDMIQDKKKNKKDR